VASERPLLLAGLIALALLALGEAAPGAFPESVVIEARSDQLQVTVDGQTHALTSALGGAWEAISLEQPGPLDREYQIDGSDTTVAEDRVRSAVKGLLDSPLYTVDSWLRDESSYSRWEHLRVTDLASGQTLGSDGPLPADFRVQADLRRPEAPARLWLIGRTADTGEGLELDRDRRNARWLIHRNGATDALPRWFFPEQPAPFAAELLNLVGRSAAIAYALLLVAIASRRLRSPSLEADLVPGDVVAILVLTWWLCAASYVTIAAYHQLPHILDGISYTFQAGVFASGQLSLPAPPATEAFMGPFEVLWQGRVFSQYPPGAPALYAVGSLLHFEWLVGPLACLMLIAATAWVARLLFGAACGLAVLVLGALSPFVLFQAGAFMSHAPAAGLLAAALAAFVAAERTRSPRWYAVSGALLGAGFMVREVASVLFALPLGARLVALRRWEALAIVSLFGLPFVMGYAVYNVRETGSPWLLPRMIFDAADHFGFGDGIGFHSRHTLAAGLANTDELLTLLQFDLFGWPPLFVFGLMALPFLSFQAGEWDRLAAVGFVAFVVAYAAYFYHGIALGPRYYFEALPWLLLLAGRGLQTLARLARSRLVAALVVSVLSLNTVLFYTPAELARRTDLGGLPNGARLTLSFVESTVFGPQLTGVAEPSLVLTNDWWLYNAALSTLNCARLSDCGVLFALAPTPEDATRLHALFPERALLRAVYDGATVRLEPY
jgi:hypothetical protein